MVDQRTLTVWFIALFFVLKQSAAVRHITLQGTEY